MADVTLSCSEPGCDYSATGPASGRGSAAWRLGGHKAQKHKLPGKTAKRSKKPSGRDKPVIVAAAEAAAAEVSERTTRPPTVEELTKAGARFFGTLSVAAASWAAETNPYAETEAQREQIADYLSLDPEGASQIAYPFARALGRSKLNARYGRGVVDNIDVVSAVSELALYGFRWRRYMRDMELMRLAMANRGVAPEPAWAESRPAAPPDLRVVHPPEGPGQMRGVVVSAADLGGGDG